MADDRIPSHEDSIKKSHVSLIPTPFELFATRHGYDLTPAVSPTDIRIYADVRTQNAYEAWRDGASTVARMITESTLETPALREKIRELAGLE
jgi:hypothetical protein